MAATFDSDISVQVVLSEPDPQRVAFGVPLYAAHSMGVGFVSGVRSYETSKGVDSDTDLSAAIQAVLKLGFRQKRRTANALVGKVGTTAQNAWRLTITDVGDDGDTITLTVDGVETGVIKLTGDSIGDLTDQLAEALNTNINYIAALDSGTYVDITADKRGRQLVVTLATTGTLAATLTEETTTAVLADDLDALKAASAWYAFTIESKHEDDIAAASAWAEANNRLFIAQSSDSDILDNVDTDIASILADAEYEQTALLYYPTDATGAAWAWLVNRSATDPDVRATTWKSVGLVDVVASEISEAQKTRLKGKNCNMVLPMFSDPRTGEGVNTKGRKLDQVVAANWLQVRLEEALVDRITRAIDAGEKIPYDDDGIAMMVAEGDAVLTKGINARHFKAGSKQFSFPTAASLDAATLASRKLTFDIGAAPLEAIEGVSLTAYISLDLDLAA